MEWRKQWLEKFPELLNCSCGVSMGSQSLAGEGHTANKSKHAQMRYPGQGFRHKSLREAKTMTAEEKIARRHSVWRQKEQDSRDGGRRGGRRESRFNRYIANIQNVQDNIVGFAKKARISKHQHLQNVTDQKEKDWGYKTINSEILIKAKRMYHECAQARNFYQTGN